MESTSNGSRRARRIQRKDAHTREKSRVDGSKYLHNRVLESPTFEQNNLAPTSQHGRRKTF